MKNEKSVLKRAAVAVLAMGLFAGCDANDDQDDGLTDSAGDTTMIGSTSGPTDSAGDDESGSTGTSGQDPDHAQLCRAHCERDAECGAAADFCVEDCGWYFASVDEELCIQPFVEMLACSNNLECDASADSCVAQADDFRTSCGDPMEVWDACLAVTAQSAKCDGEPPTDLATVFCSMELVGLLEPCRQASFDLIDCELGLSCEQLSDPDATFELCADQWAQTDDACF